MIGVGMRPNVHVIEGTMDAQDLEALTRWIELNREVILRYWNEQIDPVDALKDLESL